MQEEGTSIAISLTGRANVLPVCLHACARVRMRVRACVGVGVGVGVCVHIYIYVCACIDNMCKVQDRK